MWVPVTNPRDWFCTYRISGDGGEDTVGIGKCGKPAVVRNDDRNYEWHARCPLHTGEALMREDSCRERVTSTPSRFVEIVEPIGRRFRIKPGGVGAVVYTMFEEDARALFKELAAVFAPELTVCRFKEPHDCCHRQH